MSERIAIPEEAPVQRERENECHISLGADGIWVRFDRPLPDGPHKPPRMETMVAGALLGIARTLTGRGEEAVIDAIAGMEKKGKARR